MSRPVLVIKHGAFGDVILSLEPLTAIRNHHPHQKLIVLTTRPFAAFYQTCPLVDEVWTDDKPGWTDLRGWLKLRRRIRSANFECIYDLQGSGRTNRLFQILRPFPPDWNGTAGGCRYRDPSPAPKKQHPLQRHRQQLSVAGIKTFPPADWSWFTAPANEKLTVPGEIALIVPGCAPHRPEKRWPAAAYAELALKLNNDGLTPVLIGTRDEETALTVIARSCPSATNLMGKTTLPQLADLARTARIAIGNDTGPMHLIAAVGCPSLTLFSAASSPERSAPSGPRSEVLQHDPLSDLPVNSVYERLKTLLVPDA